MSSVMSATATSRPDNLYGLAAEFETPEAVIAAANAVRKAGYTQAEAYSPFPVEGLDTALGHRATGLGFVTLIAGTVGALAGFFMQWYANVVFYPLNIGGRPLNSWPNFIIISFEISVLFAALASVAYMIIRNGLPRAYHPIFNTPGFENATRDRFFLCIEVKDPKFDLTRTRALLEKQQPLRVSEVER